MKTRTSTPKTMTPRASTSKSSTPRPQINTNMRCMGGTGCRKPRPPTPRPKPDNLRDLIKRPGYGWANTTNPDGSVTLGWNANVRNNDGSRTYPLPEGVKITNLKQYSMLNRKSIQTRKKSEPKVTKEQPSIQSQIQDMVNTNLRNTNRKKKRRYLGNNFGVF